MLDLERALYDLGVDVAFPTTPDIAVAVMLDLPEQRPPATARVRDRHRWVVFAVAAGVVAIVLLGLPGPRAAIADLLGIGAVRLTIVDSLPQAEVVADPPGAEFSLADARTAIDFPIATLEAEPVTVFVDRSVPGGMVTLVYDTDAGVRSLTVMQIEGSTDGGLIQKLLGPTTNVAIVETDEGPAYWIEGGPHVVMFFDRNGNLHEDESRLAENTLVYVNDGVTVRIEGAITLDQALSLAHELISSEPSALPPSS